MILVDSSVWVDYFKGSTTSHTDFLDRALGRVPIVVGDLILTEVLQGCTTERMFNDVLRVMSSLTLVTLGGQDIAVKAARNFRLLRQLGVTVRKTIDCVIATHCIENGYDLLHNDRDFEPFVKHLGLRIVVWQV